jgi:hypothetical protein
MKHRRSTVSPSLTLVLFILSLFNAPFWGSLALAQTADAKLMKRVGGCQVTGNSSSAPVVIVKLWHLAPGVNTRIAPKNTPAPAQEANLREIEKQLSKWIESKSIRTIIAEGCEGKFEDPVSFNGWTLAELRARAKSGSIDSILTHPALKLEARYGDKVETLCGDLKQAIDEELLAFSDARAASGYAGRIEENAKNPARRKIYVDGAIETYKLPAGSKPEAVQEALKTELKKNVTRIRELNLKRSQSFAGTAIVVREDPIAIIAGGSHAAEIVQTLEGRNRDCVVYEPVHYAPDEEKLMKSLMELVK